MRSFALAFPALVTAYLAYAPSDASGALQNILKNTDRTDKYRYPTDFTRDIEPVSLNCSDEHSPLTARQKPFHSHNDYWRDVPFYSGLAAGAISTEADVWLIDGTLYVGLYSTHTAYELHASCQSANYATHHKRRIRTTSIPLTHPRSAMSPARSLKPVLWSLFTSTPFLILYTA